MNYTEEEVREFKKTINKISSDCYKCCRNWIVNDWYRAKPREDLFEAYTQHGELAHLMEVIYKTEDEELIRFMEDELYSAIDSVLNSLSSAP